MESDTIIILQQIRELLQNTINEDGYFNHHTQIFEDYLAPAIAGLCCAIVVLWRANSARSSRTEKKLDECERRHKDTTDRILDLSVKIEAIKARSEGIKDITSELIKKIRGG